jgi:hypothetical protein
MYRYLSSSLSDLKNRSEKIAEREQILSISLGNSFSIAQESGEIWAAPQFLQPIPFKSDRRLGNTKNRKRGGAVTGAVPFANEVLYQQMLHSMQPSGEHVFAGGPRYGCAELHVGQAK